MHPRCAHDFPRASPAGVPRAATCRADITSAGVGVGNGAPPDRGFARYARWAALTRARWGKSIPAAPFSWPASRCEAGARLPQRALPHPPMRGSTERSPAEGIDSVDIETCTLVGVGNTDKDHRSRRKCTSENGRPGSSSVSMTDAGNYASTRHPRLPTSPLRWRSHFPSVRYLTYRRSGRSDP